MNTQELNEFNAQVDELVQQVEDRGIECGRQSTYFGDEVYVHIYGNNERAAIYSPTQFINWANWFLNEHSEDDEYQDEDAALGGTGIKVVSIWIEPMKKSLINFDKEVTLFKLFGIRIKGNITERGFKSITAETGLGALNQTLNYNIHNGNVHGTTGLRGTGISRRYKMK